MTARVLLPLHALQLALLLGLAYGAVFCCDAYYYIGTGRLLWSEGLVYGDDFAARW
jgi:hypothetical protein